MNYIDIFVDYQTLKDTEEFNDYESQYYRRIRNILKRHFKNQISINIFCNEPYFKKFFVNRELEFNFSKHLGKTIFPKRFFKKLNKKEESDWKLEFFSSYRAEYNFKLGSLIPIYCDNNFDILNRIRQSNIKIMTCDIKQLFNYLNITE